jgi:hypothetical protein
MRREPSQDVPTWMLIGRDDDATDTVPMSKRTVLAAVARRGGPRLLEATLIPALLFFVAVITVGPIVAMIVVLAWGYGAIARRLVRGQAIPAILVLATLGLTVKTLVGLASGSTFAYFIQPVATTVVLAFVFLGSVVIGRPIVARLAHDFCPLAPEIACRHKVARMFSGLTVLWALVHIVIATATFMMLVSLPVATFVALKTATSFGVTGAGILVTVTWALRIARHENLVLATI